MPKPISDPDPSASPTAPVLEEALHSRTRAEAEEVIPLVEEVAHISKQERMTGRVRVRTVTDIVEEVARTTLQEETVEVTRVPIGQVVDALPQIRTEGEVT